MHPEYLRKKDLFSKIKSLLRTYEMIEEIAAYYEEVYRETKELYERQKSAQQTQ